MQRPQLDDQLQRGLTALHLPLPEATRGRLLDYLELLERWNRSFNLTAVRDPADMIARHLLDSLSVTPYLEGDRLLDIGSGAGLPGLVLAIADPQREVHLLDANGKKARFLREAVRQLGLDRVKVLQQRVQDTTGSYPCITARAFASLPDMLAWGGHLLAPGGGWLAMKGRRPDDELATLPAGFICEAIHPLSVPGVGGERHVVTLRRTPG